MANTAMTELDAVNRMLLAIGEAPVNSLTGTGLDDVDMARQTLEGASRDLQTQGFEWNTNRSMVLAPEYGTGFILLPANALTFAPVGASADATVVRRGTKLYDNVANTYVFTTEVTADIVVMLPFEELSQLCRSYLSWRAAMDFQEAVLGAEKITKFISDNVQRSWLAFYQETVAQEDNRFLLSGYEPATVLLRR